MEIIVSLVPSLITTLSICFFPRLMFLFTEAVFGKFNCSLPSDDDFMNAMTLLITTEKEKIPLFSSLADWWDNLKIQIRRTCINFSSRKRKQLLSERNS